MQSTSYYQHRTLRLSLQHANPNPNLDLKHNPTNPNPNPDSTNPYPNPKPNPIQTSTHMYFTHHIRRLHLKVTSAFYPESI